MTMIIYEGASLYDGEPIVVILTGATGSRSSNRKTGGMAQTWILRADIAPTDAVRSGADSTICGSCPMRGNGFSKRACYVNVGQAPQSIYRAYARGSYSRVTPAEANAILASKGLGVRLGAYGDPYAVPEWVWQSLTHGIRRITGYSHGPETPHLAMRSIETAAQALQARAEGIRYFRVIAADASPLPGEIECPADARGMTCEKCGLCDGSRRNGERQALGLPILPSVYIRAHGPGARHVA